MFILTRMVLIGVLALMSRNIFAASVAVGGALIDNHVFLEADQQALQPQLVKTTSKGNFIVAGSAGLAAWATEIDPEGKTVWAYTAPSPDTSPASRFPSDFRCAAPMADGSVIFGGNMPRTPPLYTSALLARIDANGHLLSQRFVAPAERTELGAAYIHDCIPWEGGVVSVGYVHNVVHPASGANPPVTESFYWLLAMDEAGIKKWERLIPILSNFGVPDVGPLVAIDKSGLAFSATDNVNTEIVRVNPDGMISARKRLSGRYGLIREPIQDGILEIWGGLKDGPSTLVHLDTRLDENDRTEGQFPKNFISRLMYRNHDQSLVLFGSQTTPGGQYKSRIAIVEPSLQTGQYLDPELNQGTFFDRGSIWAAAPTFAPGQFVTARSLAVTQSAANSPNVPRDFERGAVIDIVKLPQKQSQ
jgi:hypothetical protein